MLLVTDSLQMRGAYSVDKLYLCKLEVYVQMEQRFLERKLRAEVLNLVFCFSI